MSISSESIYIPQQRIWNSSYKKLLNYLHTRPKNYNIVIRPKNITYFSENVILKIKNWIKEIQQEFRPELLAEPNRLLEKNEYRAAVISSFSLLEKTLQQILSSTNIPSDIKKLRRSTLFSMLNVCIEFDIVTKAEVNKIREWRNIRNNLIHTGDQITKNKATKIVNDINAIVVRIQENPNFSLDN